MPIRLSRGSTTCGRVPPWRVRRPAVEKRTRDSCVRLDRSRQGFAGSGLRGHGRRARRDPERDGLARAPPLPTSTGRGCSPTEAFRASGCACAGSATWAPPWLPVDGLPHASSRSSRCWSPRHIVSAPRCRHASLCGGCSWQHVAYAEQLRLKTRALATLLERAAGLRRQAPARASDDRLAGRRGRDALGVPAEVGLRLRRRRRRRPRHGPLRARQPRGRSRRGVPGAPRAGEPDRLRAPRRAAARRNHGRRLRPAWPRAPRARADRRATGARPWRRSSRRGTTLPSSGRCAHCCGGRSDPKGSC